MHDIFENLFEPLNDWLNPPELICRVPFYNVCGTNSLSVVEKFIQQGPALSFMRDRHCLVIHTDPCTTSFHCTSKQGYARYKEMFTENVGIIDLHSFASMLKLKNAKRFKKNYTKEWNERLLKLRTK